MNPPSLPEVVTGGVPGTSPIGTVITVASHTTGVPVTVVETQGAPGVTGVIKTPIIPRVVRTENGGIAI